MSNRLKLDFSLPTAQERQQFVDSYIQQPYFKTAPLTNDELETIANYILWGYDETGKNAVQQKTIQIKTKNGTWDNTTETESLDALMETPTFNEATLRPVITRASQPKVVKQKFSREEALSLCTQNQLLYDTFVKLFREIDELELMLNFYDLAHNKRKLPPRESLTSLFTSEQQNQLREQSTHLNPYTYLKRRHRLVELRRQQFTLRDSLKTTIMRHTPAPIEEVEIAPSFEADIPVYPLGIINSNNKATLLIFAPPNELNPSILTNETDARAVSNYYWKKMEAAPTTHFDFRNIEHVYQLFLNYFDLEDSGARDNLYSTTTPLLRTLFYYIDMAQLSDVHREILDLKVRGTKNQPIADYINKKYNKSYTANYISTLFRQKIIVSINKAADMHERIVGNLFFKENFKACATCGRILLRDPDNFVRKGRASDGFSSHCKNCEKQKRRNKKNENK